MTFLQGRFDVRGVGERRNNIAVSLDGVVINIQDVPVIDRAT